MARIQELREELVSVLSGRGIKLADSTLPLVIFLLGNWLLDLFWAIFAGIAVGVLFLIYRLIKKEKLVYAITGIGAVGIAAGIAFLSNLGTGFLIPGLVSGLLTVLVCIGSVLIKKPLAAWTSMISRRWPREWYWLDQVRPAYAEVTLIWAAAFGLRTGLEYWLLDSIGINSLGITKIILGWPYTILILVLSYFFGVWRLGTLKGPSVEEYKNGVSPPWEGQTRGF
jgi:hypothetical protein